MIFYWTDDHLNKYEDGVVTTYSPAGGPPSSGLPNVMYFTLLPDNQILAVGTTERLSGEDAWGWIVDLDLNVIEDRWGVEDDVSEGAWVFPNGDQIYAAGSDAASGAGILLDPDTGDVLISSIFTRDEGPPTYTNVGEHLLLRMSVAGDVLDSHIESSSGSPEFNFYGSDGIFASEGVGLIGRKYYYSAGSGANSVGEYDLDTHAFRFAEFCFEFNGGSSLIVHEGALWRMEGEPQELDHIARLHRYDVESIPWGSSSVIAVPDDTYELFDDDNSSTTQPFSDVYGLTFVATDTVLFQANIQGGVYGSTPAFFTQSLSAATPTLLYALPETWFDDHSGAYQIYGVWDLIAPPLRLTQRNDGLGIFKHPRLANRGGANEPSSEQTSHRIQKNNGRGYY